MRFPTRSAAPPPRHAIALSLGLLFVGLAVGELSAQEAVPPHWVWVDGEPQGSIGPVTRYFRKAFSVKEPSKLAIDATADNEVTVYLDGKELLRGDNWETAQSAAAPLASGDHVLAAVATNTDQGPGSAGFLLRGSIAPLGQGVPIHSDRTWRGTKAKPEGDAWLKPGFDDRRWAHVADFGVFGTAPWGDRVAFGGGDGSSRFKVADGFAIETVASPSVTGSAISFTFDHKARPVVGVERQPIARLDDADGDGTYEGRTIIAPALINCQGLSFIKGALYAVGDGPKGAGLYRLTDADGDGIFTDVTLIREGVGGMGEHGPHAVTLGPDGKLYFNSGNHAHLKGPIDPASPMNILYEGELLPHYNDPRGHAAGIVAPGGEIYRSDDEGKTWKRVAGGFRNQYDFAFNRLGEAFTFDSDMEWDIGLPWYRPVRVNQAIVGADFGWRTGSAVWPVTFFDSLPTTLDLGRGSPTGVTFYQGNTFPEGYDDSFLICDWSQGRILSVKLTPSGATYAGKATELVTGQPLNCTDIEVGPDGSVYFTTGGRGTQGGLFRVGPKGAKVATTPQDGIAEVLALGAPQSSFSRAKAATIKAKLGAEWGTKLTALLGSTEATSRQKVRALDLLAEFGPEPTVAMLAKVATDADARVRSRALSLIGLHQGAEAVAALTRALGDPEVAVARRACEGLTQQAKGSIPVAKLIPLLASPDRWLRTAARTAIEHGDVSAHEAALKPAGSTRTALEGMLAIVRATKLDAATAASLLDREATMAEGKSSLKADEYLDLLRLVSLTFQLGPKGADQPVADRFRKAFLAAYPAGDDDTNRELARLLAYLDEPRAVKAILDHQADSGTSKASQILDAYCLRAMKNGWDAASKRRALAWFGTASHWDGGFSFLGYLEFMIQDLLPRFTPDEVAAALADGQSNPFATRVLVRSLKLDADPGRIADLVTLDDRVASGTPGPMATEVRALILETLGNSPRPEARAALGTIARRDPGRRDLIARALCAKPTPDDAPFLAEALATRDPNTASQVVKALKGLPKPPEGAGPLKELLGLARRTGPSFAGDLDTLAARWTGDAGPSASDRDYDARLKHWESVYAKAYPAGPTLGHEAAVVTNAYTLPQLTTAVVNDRALTRSASAERGREVITRARCLDCHKLGDKGAGLGPDLTTVRSRFSPAEILESILLPSKVVSDQYKSKAVALADGRVVSGMPVVTEGENLVLLLSDGTRTTIKKADIEETKDSPTSVMPEGLINALSLRDISDLLALFNSMPRVEAPAAGASGAGK